MGLLHIDDTNNVGQILFLQFAIPIYWDISKTVLVIFCSSEVRAMVVAVQQPLGECTAIFTVGIVKHRPPPCAVTMHKT